MIHLYTGDGKGKTTAAVGLAVRAAGAGHRVIFSQFMKGNDTAEIAVLEKQSNIQIIRSKKDYPFYWNMTDEDKAGITLEHNQIIDEVHDIILKYMNSDSKTENLIIIFDEITYPINYKLIDESKVKSILDSSSNEIEIICTGRDAAAFIRDKADYITNMTCERHPYDKGVSARYGIEY